MPHVWERGSLHTLLPQEARTGHLPRFRSGHGLNQKRGDKCQKLGFWHQGSGDQGLLMALLSDGTKIISQGTWSWFPGEELNNKNQPDRTAPSPNPTSHLTLPGFFPSHLYTSQPRDHHSAQDAAENPGRANGAKCLELPDSKSLATRISS